MKTNIHSDSKLIEVSLTPQLCLHKDRSRHSIIIANTTALPVTLYFGNTSSPLAVVYVSTTDGTVVIHRDTIGDAITNDVYIASLNPGPVWITNVVSCQCKDE